MLHGDKSVGQLLKSLYLFVPIFLFDFASVNLILFISQLAFTNMSIGHDESSWPWKQFYFVKACFLYTWHVKITLQKFEYYQILNHQGIPSLWKPLVSIPSSLYLITELAVYYPFLAEVNAWLNMLFSFSVELSPEESEDVLFKEVCHSLVQYLCCNVSIVICFHCHQ